MLYIVSVSAFDFPLSQKYTCVHVLSRTRILLFFKVNEEKKKCNLNWASTLAAYNNTQYVCALMANIATT